MIMDSQAGSVVSVTAFHLCGPRFDTRTRALHVDWGFQSLPGCEGFPYRFFFHTSKTRSSSLPFLQKVGVMFPAGCFADYMIQTENVNDYLNLSELISISLSQVLNLLFHSINHKINVFSFFLQVLDILVIFTLQFLRQETNQAPQQIKNGSLISLL